MRLEFEKWLDNQKIPVIATEVFREAVICYKVNAYRAAMLLSFSGFQIILKSRINSADKPDGVIQKKWDEYKSKINDDGGWDTYLSNNIIVATDTKCKIFEIHDDLIGQYAYWKYRRNDAAHSKDNKLTNSHIETFWIFLESNLPKFVIIGSHQELINKIKGYFDLNQTTRSADFAPLVAEIPKAIDSKKKNSFLDSLKNIISNSLRPEEQKLNFWNALLDLPEINEEVQNFLLNQENQKLYYKIIQLHPTRLAVLNEQVSFLRKVYMEWLFQKFHFGDFKIFTYLSKHRIVPEDEFKDVVKMLLYKWHRIHYEFGDFLPEGEDLEILTKTFNPVWEEIILLNIGNWDWANETRNRDAVESFLKINGVSEPIVEKFCSLFSASYHPWGMDNTLNSFFGLRANANHLEDFLRIAKEKKFKSPTSWNLKKKAERMKEVEKEVMPEDDLTL